MMSELKKIICSWDLKFKNKIEFKINVKIKLGQILGFIQNLIVLY